MAVNNTCGDQVIVLSRNISDYSYKQLESVYKWLQANHGYIEAHRDDNNQLTGEFNIVLPDHDTYTLFQLTWGPDDRDQHNNWFI